MQKTERRESNMSEMASIEPAPFRFLDLPPELRNRVYNYALVTPGQPIIVTPILQPPSLLSASRGIRHENLLLWYRCNYFQLTIYNCNARLQFDFTRHIAKLGLSVKLDSLILGLDWRNLMEWCYLVWSGQLRAIRYVSPPMTDVLMVIIAAHLVAFEGRKAYQSWQVCEMQLAGVRLVAGRLDAGWMR